MGYMGFGMKKEAYSRAPRKHMAYLDPWLRYVKRTGVPENAKIKEPKQRTGIGSSHRYSPYFRDIPKQKAIALLVAVLCAILITYASILLVAYLLGRANTNF